jgi:hypothetical protein
MAQTTRFQGTARAVIDTPAGRSYCYHRTAVCTLRPDGSIVLNSGGWRTATTQRAINQALSELRRPERVSQRDFTWYVGDVEFFDGITLGAL